MTHCRGCLRSCDLDEPLCWTCWRTLPARHQQAIATSYGTARDYLTAVSEAADHVRRKS